MVATENAFVNSNASSIGLSHNNDQAVLELGVGPGTYLVFGRVVIGNNDGDPQGASARMTGSRAGLIDSVTLRLPAEGSAQTVALQGTLCVEPNDIEVIGIHC